MGFFHYEKELDRNQDYFEIKINKKNLNDVLTSIMVFTSSGTITSIAYSSDIKETIKEKYLDYGNYFDYILSTMRGQKLRFTLKNQEKEVIGLLIGGESYDSSFKSKNNVVEQYFVLFNNSGNQLVQLPFSQVDNIEPVDNNVKNEFQKALEVISSQNKEETVLKIFYNKEDSRDDLRAVIGYAIPVSLWKMNYRIKIGKSKDKALLDSFCIINNPLQQDWVDTEISLITGRPVSFIYSLDRTDKLKRSVMAPSNFSGIDPVVEGNNSSYTAPSTGSYTTPATNDSFSENDLKEELDKVPTSLVKQSDLNLLRYNLISTVSKLLDKKVDELQEQSMDKVLQSILTPDNNFARMNLGQDYQFHIKGVKTIKAKENAIIPIFTNQKVPCVKLLYMEYPSEDNHPYTSIELFNEGDYPLENGPAVIFEEDSPVGETILPTCFTSQSRIISYSKEPRMNVRQIKVKLEQSEKKYEIIRKPLAVIEKFTEFEIISFKITNNLPESMDNPELLVFDYKHIQDWDVVKEELGEVRCKNLEKGYRFSIPLKPNKSFTINLKFTSDVSNEKAIQSITKSYYEIFKEKITEEDIKEKFEEYFRLTDELEKLYRQTDKLNEEKRSVETLIARLRNNLKAIPETGNKVRNNFVLRLNKFEDDIDRINKEITVVKDQTIDIKNKLEALQ